MTNPEQARALAEQIGYPLLVKAAGGGGGRGIKRVEDDDELDSLISLARSEAGSAFGDDRVYLEKLIESARHVEVQIAADEHRTVLHLGERDCTVQRRFQKVVEEALAPQLSDATRRRLQQAAVAFAERIGYRNLGTAEFVIDAATGEPYFLEMNCRIQVEHPVTEAITYLDLVADAAPDRRRPSARDRAGRRLLPRPRDRVPAQRRGPEPTATGPARARCRCSRSPSATACAWTPTARRGPRCRRTTTRCWPSSSGTAADREHAIEILIEALEDLDVDGVETNRTLLIGILGHPDFRAGPVTTDWLERALR